MSPVARSVLAGLCAFSLARGALAEVRVTVRPVFGDGCLPRGAPTELIATVDNPLATALQGTLVLDHAMSPASRLRTLRAVSVSVAARSRVDVHLATADIVPGNDLVAVLRDARGELLAHADITSARYAERMVVDATQGSRLALSLRGAQGPEGLGNGLADTNGQPTACAVERVAATGDPVLPWSAQGYAQVSVVLIDTGTLTSMGVRERVVLADYVLGGGTLAVVVDHPEDLAHPVLTALIGRDVTAGPMAAPARPTPGIYPYYRAPTAGVPVTAQPAPDTLAHALSFTGGNLHNRVLPQVFPSGTPDALGATAEYGHGQVHLLSFNPTRAPALDDAWSGTVVQHIGLQGERLRQRRLLSDARDSASVPSSVRALLSRPDTARGGIRHALALLSLYSLALPLALLAARALTRRRLGLVAIPAGALLATAALLGLAVRERATLASARSVAVLDLAAGFPRGAVRRFHAYTPRADGPLALRIDGADRALVLDPEAGRGVVRAVTEPVSTSLAGVNVRAWTPLLVRDEGFETLRGNVSIVTDNTLGLRVINRLPEPLEDVILLDADGASGWYFRWIPAGASRRAVWGAPLSADAARALHDGDSTEGLPLWGSERARQMAAALTPTALTPTAPPAASAPTPDSGYGAFHLDPPRSDAWRAALAVAEMTSPHAWQAAAEPVLLARIVRAAPPADNGMSVVREDTWVRVRGYGGAP